MAGQGNEMRDTIQRGLVRMRRRREVVERVSRLARRSPGDTARGLIRLAGNEAGRLRLGLRDRYGFVAGREEPGRYAWRFTSSRRPGTPAEKAEWLDATVHLLCYERALDVMRAAAAYHREAGEDQGRAVVGAFCDVYERAPALYNAFAACEGFDASVRDYASAMAGAWVRAYLRAFPGSKVEQALKGEDWAAELANATVLAWSHRDPDAPLKRGTRFRDTLPRQADGRRQKAPGPRDFVNEVSRVLEGRDSGEAEKTEPPEWEPFTLAEQERMRRAARDAGLTAQEREVFGLLLSNPRITNPEIAARLGITRNHAGVVRHKVLKQLGA